MTTQTTIGTICHNDDNARDPGHRRVEVWVDEDGTIWADRNNPHRPELPKARDADHAAQLAAQAWSGPQWDWQPAN